jgi:spore coat protein A
MKISRRDFLLSGAGLFVPMQHRGAVPPSLPMCQSGARAAKVRAEPPPRLLHAQALPRFVDRLPVPVVAPPERRNDPLDAKQSLPYYRLRMHEIETPVHRDLKPTRWWSYGDTVPGPTFETRSGQALLIEWVNDLPARHFLPIDRRLHGAGAELPDVRTVVHVHGAKVPPESDGYPDRWFVHGQSAVYRYPNRQDATLLWYHDHAMGIERLNQYAGLFGAFVIRDPVEDALELPGGAYEIPLIIFDRLLDENGQLYYPVSGVPDAPWVSEVYGDAVLVNGKLYPYLDVEPRPYRFRLLNASNARFYYLALSDDRPFHIIGTDQGLLPAPVQLSRLTLAPAERADLIIDFSGLAGRSLVLGSQAFELMQFRVAPRKAAPVRPLPRTLRPVPKTAEAAAVKTRALTLNEYENPQTHGMIMLLDGRYWSDAVTETPLLDSVEIWEFVNLTGDTHPIHLHLVRFQILDRQPFDIDAYLTSGTMRHLGPAMPPRPEEAGWKDTVQALPEMITRIVVRFEGYAGRYVWHCHLLEHAANQMMRPFEVLPRPA